MHAHVFIVLTSATIAVITLFLVSVYARRKPVVIADKISILNEKTWEVWSTGCERLRLRLRLNVLSKMSIKNQFLYNIMPSSNRKQIETRLDARRKTRIRSIQTEPDLLKSFVSLKEEMSI